MNHVTTLSHMNSFKAWLKVNKLVRSVASLPLNWSDRYPVLSPKVLYLPYLYTLLQNKRGRWAAPHRSFENRWRNIDILYIILKEIVWRFWFSLNFQKYFDVVTLWANFRKMTPQWLLNGCLKKFKLLKYQHIIYSFEARNLEILNM